jgi:predicted RNase H-like HicB family nuclease
MSEIVFEAREDEVKGGYIASALGYGIHTQGETLEELRSMVKEAIDCYFDESVESPKVVRLEL